MINPSSIIAKLKENDWSDEDIKLVRYSAEFYKYSEQPRELTQRSKSVHVPF